jgi:hypothetical protein
MTRCREWQKDYAAREDALQQGIDGAEGRSASTRTPIAESLRRLARIARKIRPQAGGIVVC